MPLTGEVPLVAVRARDGETCLYPPAYNAHDSGILRLSMANSGHPLQALAESRVGHVSARPDYAGVLASKFLEVDGGLEVNETAPRAHNSGHWAIEGTECSRFENHLRVVAGLPLDSTAKVGESTTPNFIDAVSPMDRIVAAADCHPYHYGKAFKNDRRAGHATLRCVDWVALQARITEIEVLIEA